MSDIEANLEQLRQIIAEEDTSGKHATEPPKVLFTLIGGIIIDLNRIANSLERIAGAMVDDRPIFSPVEKSDE